MPPSPPHMPPSPPQGIGGPTCASVLTKWFAAGERGTYWGMWNIAHNLGGFAAPVIVGYVAKEYGWRWGMWAPGTIGLVMAAVVYLAVKDSPQAAGYPAVELPAAAVGAAGRCCCAGACGLGLVHGSHRACR